MLGAVSQHLVFVSEHLTRLSSRPFHQHRFRRALLTDGEATSKTVLILRWARRSFQSMVNCWGKTSFCSIRRGQSRFIHSRFLTVSTFKVTSISKRFRLHILAYVTFT